MVVCAIGNPNTPPTGVCYRLTRYSSRAYETKANRRGDITTKGAFRFRPKKVEESDI